MRINKDLQNYIVNNILPLYEQNDEGHNLTHINYVIKRSLNFAKQFPNINLNMVYTIASFHDLAHHIDKDKHEILSAQIFYENKEMKKYFSLEERKTIRDAIIDHRASLKYIPRSDYGKIISSADRNVDIDDTLKRIHAYSLKHYPDLNLEDIIFRAYKAMTKKFGKEGYAKTYCQDQEFEKFKLECEELLKDKYNFILRYMKANDVFDVKLKAKFFAVKAHQGQVRKSEVDKPMIIHPISVGNILSFYGYDDNVIAAGFLHDVVEDTKYTIDDIKNEFCEDIASLVMGASEPDKSLSWEERKKHTISEIKKLPLRNKLVICADKINNLEDLYVMFMKNGKRDFTAFKRDEEKQKWYYTSVYESLILNEDEKLPIFVRLKDILTKFFNPSDDLFLKEKIFNDNLEYYEELKKLHGAKMEIQRLKELVNLSKPFVIEFSGTPRTGKTTIINRINEFFKKGNFKINLVNEFTTSKRYKEVLQKKWASKNHCDLNLAILKEITNELQKAVSLNDDIILIDRSINDRQIWNYRLYKKQEMPVKIYEENWDKYMALSKKLIDFFVLTYAPSIVALKRDYLSSVTLEKRSFLNENNLNEFNDSLNDLKDFFKNCVDSYLFLDTSDTSIDLMTISILKQILLALRLKYIERFKEKYEFI